MESKICPDSDTFSVRSFNELNKSAAVQMSFWSRFFSFVQSAAVHQKKVRVILDYDTVTGNLNFIFSKSD